MANLSRSVFPFPFSYFLLFFLCFFSVQFLSLAYDLPVKYFVNCGSGTDVTDAGRTFVGDLNPDKNFGISSGKGEVKNLMGSSPLYNSARIFRELSYYEFEIDQSAVHIVRLHFFPLNSSDSSLFDVSASGFFLLRNFTAVNVSNNDSPIKEFFIPLKPGKFGIFFWPKSPSIAYVNAIEVFPTPPDFIPVKSPLITPTGKNGDSIIFPSQILKTIYRINVGGPKINTNEGDKLWRIWDEDDKYLVNRSTAINSAPYSQPVNYKNDPYSLYFAPDSVYNTAKHMNKNSNSRENFNITWSFSVRKETKHFVRAHFFDIIAEAVNKVLFFNLFVGNSFSIEINPNVYNGQWTVPFNEDFVVDSGKSGFLNVSVGPRMDAMQIDAYLNGLEIMEAMDELSVDPIININEKNNNRLLPLIIGSVIGGFGFFCIMGFVIWFVLKRRKTKAVETASVWSPLNGFVVGSTHSRISDRSRTVKGSPIPNLNLGLRYSLADIQTATNNFHKKFLIGEGGFGKVYRGILSNMKVAVKRSQPGTDQGIPEFESEIMILSRIRHRHLVSFLGYCDEAFEMILVYEFMENGTLRQHLYDSKLPPLSWKKRLEICIGAARGIQYLHKGSAGGIIHRDIKSTNILLDENLVAKVADFGLSRTGPLDQDETHVSTAVKGTFGYLDPEYFRTQQLTEKSDVYSFGVLLLEVLCARSALDPTLPRDQINLAEWGLKCKKNGVIQGIIDPKLEGQIDPNSLRKYSETIEKCLQDDGEHRPSMGDVLWDLEYSLQLQQSAQWRMPHEDSTTNMTGSLTVPMVQRFPSIGSSVMIGELDASENQGFDLTSAESEVFSQIKADGGR